MSSVNDLVQLIQLAVSPVFLLAGIAGFLNVMSGRLGRIVDRARIVEQRLYRITNEDQIALAQYELKLLWRRVKINNWSLTACTASGLMVCVLIVSLFLGDIVEFDIHQLIIILFILSMLCLIFALSLFLVEVQLGTRSMRAGKERLFDDLG